MASDTTSFTTAFCRNRKPDTCRGNRHETRFAKHRLPIPRVGHRWRRPRAAAVQLGAVHVLISRARSSISA